uniref:Probable imidazolonepropionase n=1 Tax=Rhabditophanes sp. KR3021 TaxID=114890 RepID=A0AC35TRY4_9BILA
MDRLLIFNLKQIVQIVDNTTTQFLRGKEETNNIKVLNDPDSRLCCLVDGNGLIKYVGLKDDTTINGDKVEKTVDGNEGVLIPGFVDGHTHPVFAGDRVHEFAMKLAGATYMDVQAAGGGIHFTTIKTNEASKDSLLADFKVVADQMLKSGTTTVEAKSGYGLNTECEVKMLQVLEEASQQLDIEISSTFCGAHAIPRGVSEKVQTREIVDNMIPTLVSMKAQGKLNILENIDVFCEKKVFELESSKEILVAGKNSGLRINFHADELTPLGGAEMGASINAHAMSHLEEISDEGISAMAKSDTVAVLLPTTAIILKLPAPPARKMIDASVIVALGSDFNPNAYCSSMPTVMHLACITFRMSMAEALVGATLNSAFSIGRGQSHGAIAKGRVGDLVLLEASSWEHIIYRLSGHQHIIKRVIKKGKIVA